MCMSRYPHILTLRTLVLRKAVRGIPGRGPAPLGVRHRLRLIPTPPARRRNQRPSCAPSSAPTRRLAPVVLLRGACRGRVWFRVFPEVPGGSRGSLDVRGYGWVVPRVRDDGGDGGGPAQDDGGGYRSDDVLDFPYARVPAHAPGPSCLTWCAAFRRCTQATAGRFRRPIDHGRLTDSGRREAITARTAPMRAGGAADNREGERA
jgi:hypothetical protein